MIGLGCPWLKGAQRAVKGVLRQCLALYDSGIAKRSESIFDLVSILVIFSLSAAGKPIALIIHSESKSVRNFDSSVIYLDKFVKAKSSRAKSGSIFCTGLTTIFEIGTFDFKPQNASPFIAGFEISRRPS